MLTTQQSIIIKMHFCCCSYFFPIVFLLNSHKIMHLHINKVCLSLLGEIPPKPGASAAASRTHPCQGGKETTQGRAGGASL